MQMESIMDTNDIAHCADMGETTLDEDVRRAARTLFKKRGATQGREGQKKL